MGLFWIYFLQRHSSFWSQLNTGWIPLSPDPSRQLPTELLPPSALNLPPLCLWALSASRWATSVGLTAWQAGFQSSPRSLVHLTPDHFPLSRPWLAGIAEEDREGVKDYEMICNPCRRQAQSERSDLTADGKSCWIFQEKIRKLTHNKLEFSFSNLKAASTT